MLTIEATESAKSLETVGRILDAALAHRVDRGGVLVSVGGGITGDLVGWAAALHLRGVEVMHVPTTLLAMVDAALGGKTGANRPPPDGSLGKSSWCVLATLLCIGRRGDLSSLPIASDGAAWRRP